MKKTLALIALAAPALAGTKTVVATVPAPAPTPAPAPIVSPWAIEVGTGYNFASKDLFKGVEDQKKVNTWGWDLTGVYKLDENNALTLRLGYAYGSRKQDNDIRYKVNNWSLMPGYRYTYALDDQWSLFAGVNVGVTNMKWRITGDFPAVEKSGWGFGYSAELGVRYAINTNWDVFAAYQFSGSTASPKYTETFDGQYGPESVSTKAKAQNYHGVRIGVGYTF